jgi:hypothetical protein
VSDITREEVDAKLEALMNKLLAKIDVLSTRMDGLEKRFDDLQRQNYMILVAVIGGVFINHWWK